MYTSGDIVINNRNIFILYLKLYCSNIALSNDNKFPIQSNGPKMSDFDTTYS